MKRSLTHGALVAAILAVSTAASAAGFSGFNLPDWSESHTPDDTGSVATGGAPSSVSLIGSDNSTWDFVNDQCGTGNCTHSFLKYSFVAPSSGTITFNWNYATADTSHDASVDPAGYFKKDLNSPTQLTAGAAVSQNGSGISTSLLAGQTFGFYVETTDNTSGAATLTISGLQFLAAAPVPEPSSALLLGAGALALFGIRRRLGR